MVEKRTYVEVVLIITLMASLGINITNDDAADNIYGCDVESVDDMYCFKLSKLNHDGIQRNCYYNEESSRKYKVCSSGWEKITLEEVLNNQLVTTEIKGDLSDASQWLCSPNGCEAII